MYVFAFLLASVSNYDGAVVLACACVESGCFYVALCLVSLQPRGGKRCRWLAAAAEAEAASQPMC